MYKASAIIESWMKLNAWRQQYDPNGQQLEVELTQGESGLFYQGEHPMLTLQNLESIMPNYSQVNYPDWSNTTPYLKDDIVKTGGIKYKAKVNNTAKAPAANLTEWKIFNPFSEWIKTKTEDAILDAVIAFLENKEMNSTAKTLLENKTLFDGTGQISNAIENQDRRAGFEIVQSKSRGLTARLDRIGLQFSTNTPVVIQLHHSSKKEALKTLEIAYNKNGSFQWVDLGWDLPNVSTDTDSGGTYFVTYKQSQLTNEAKAIQKEKQWNEAPCESCVSKSELSTWNTYSPYIEFHPFNVPEQIDEELWDITDNRYQYSTNNGLNFAISLYCDYTSFFIEQRDLFKSLLRKQVAINLVREIAYNPASRINQNESTVTREQLIYEIDGDPRGFKNTGLFYKYTQSLQAISLNVEGLHRVCLPCKKTGVKYATI
jgi:hypothetical protein